MAMAFESIGLLASEVTEELCTPHKDEERDSGEADGAGN